MGVEYIQSNLTAGELTPELHARVDINKYNNGVEIAQNMVILPHGGMRRRPGLSKITDSKVAVNSRIEPFVFSTTQKYIILFRPGFVDIYRDGVVVAASIVSPYATDAVISEIDVIQSADSMIIASDTIAPYKLLRMGSDSSWSLEAIVFTNLPPEFNFGGRYVNDGTTQVVNIEVGDIIYNNDGDAIGGADMTYYKALIAQPSIDLSLEDFSNVTNWVVSADGKEPVWSDHRGWPATCTFHQNRLWFGGSTQRPTSIWASKVNGFFDFDLGTGLADEGIADTLDTDQYNKITNIFSGRKLQVFTTGGEFYNAAVIISPAESEWRRQTGYGSKRLRPILIDGATLFVDSSNRTIRQFLYDFNEDGYVALNLTLLSSHLITDVRAMAAIKGTQFDVGDYVYVVNEDGSCAVLNTMRHEQISGWTHWVTDGLFKDVIVLDKEVYFLVYREGTYFLEKLTENTYTDHNVIVDGVAPTTDSVVHIGSDVVHSGSAVVHTDFTTGTPVTSVTTDYDVVFAATQFKVIADFSIMPDATYVGTGGSNSFTITRDAYRLEVGLNFKTSVVTLPISSETKKGVTLHRRKRVVKVDINVLDSLGVYARKRYTSDRRFTVVLDQAPVPFTGFKEMYLLGYDRLQSVEIHQEEPLPFILRGIGTEIAY